MSKVLDDRMRSQLLWEIVSKVSHQGENQHAQTTRLFLLPPIQ